MDTKDEQAGMPSQIMHDLSIPTTTLNSLELNIKLFISYNKKKRVWILFSA